MPASRRVDGYKRIRYTRSINFASAVTLGASITVGVGVYVILGQLIEFSDGTTAALAYLLALVAALPMILTTAERVAFLPIQDGVYGLSRQGSLLVIPYFAGWTMFGGLACLAAMLGWGAAVYTDLLLRMFSVGAPPQVSWLAAAFTVAGVGFSLMWDRSGWQRYAWLILAGVAFLLLLSGRGFWLLDPQIGNPRTNTFDLLDVTVMIAASFWGVHFVLSMRNEMHRPTRNLLRALLTSAVLRTLVGVAAALVLVWYPGDPLSTNAPLYDIASLPGTGASAFWQITYALFGLMFCLYALRQTVDRTRELTNALRRDGFAPDSILIPVISVNVNPTHLVFWALATAGASLVSIENLIELAAVGFLVAIGLALSPALLTDAGSLPETRKLKLPFHPLFPGFTIAVSLLLTALTLDTVGLYWIAWLALGATFYALYARRTAAEARREAVVVDDESKPQVLAYGSEEARFRVLVSVDKPAEVANLLRTAVRFCHGRNAEVIVLKVLSTPAYLSDAVERGLAQEELDKLQEQIAAAIVSDADKEIADGVEISPVVRIASRAAFGILDMAADEKASLLLAAWRGEFTEERRTPDEVLNDLVRYSPCPVAILRGDMPDSLQRIVVFSAGGPNAAAALPIAEQFARLHETALELVTVNSGMGPEEAQQYLDATLTHSDNADQLNAHLVDAGSLDSGVATASKDAGLIFLGVSKEDVSDRSFFGGLAADLAYRSEIPSLLVRGQETVRYLSLRRIMDSVRDALPNLTQNERSEVAQNMREDAIPTIDFFVLITLASAIATLGLLQSSTAVIIGAMLVAPLMSPILATGMAIVMGESTSLRLAIESTAKGIAVAVFVGILVTMISPFNDPTPEILARTAPTVLDLMVALTSGAAAGYAVCRKEVAAALPGVAISAALVPPLCVVGYGIGTSQFDIATGSLVLFTTNLVAIIVAGAIVFLALGFHPPRSERDEFRRNLWVSGLSLGAVFIVLMIATIFASRDANARLAVEEVFRQDMVQRAAVIDKLEVNRQRNDYFVTATVFSFSNDTLSSQEIGRLQEELSTAVGGPVFVDLTVVPATGSDLGKAAVMLALEEYLETQSDDEHVSIAELRTTARAGNIHMLATLVSYPDSTLSAEELDTWQQTMTEIAGEPVVLDVTVVQGVQSYSGATSTPAPSP